MPESNIPSLQYPITPLRRWFGRIAYFALVALPVFFLIRELAARKIPGRYIHPPNFAQWKLLYHSQEALLVGLIIAIAGLIACCIRNRWVRFAIFFPLSLWLAWLFVWAIVRAAFTMELSPRYVIALLREPDAISAIGLKPSFFYRAVATGVGGVFVFAMIGSFLSRRVSRTFAIAVAIFVLVIFLAIHVPVRVYVVQQLKHTEQVVRALDDWSPIGLRSEEFIPGLQPARPALPNLADGERTHAYIDWIKHAPKPEIPRKIDIVWIVIEAFRADAIDEKTTPYLWSHAADFQLKLGRNHWSGGNASQFGLFSMFTGISGYHLETFTREQVGLPFMELLVANGYRLRIANRHYFAFDQFRPSMFPKSAVWGNPRAGAVDRADALMVDELLADMRSRPAAPSCDVVPFDSTHWPFAFAPEDKIFEPSATADRRPRFTRTPEEAQEVRNCYRNASHGIDRQIGRIMEALRERNALDRTIVIVTGDHGEEFFERGQIFHAGPTNDFQGRPVLWMHFPDSVTLNALASDRLTSHTDLVPTLLDVFGFKEDVLKTQGRSLLHPGRQREALMTSEQGYLVPGYHALITRDYISRWRNGSTKFLLSAVERRDGEQFTGNEWLEEARRVYPEAAGQYEILPDPAK